METMFHTTAEALQKAASKINPNLTREQIEEVKKLLSEYIDILSSGPNDMGRTDIVEHHIDTGNAGSVKQAPPRLPYALKDNVDEEVKRLMEDGLVTPSKSPWASPIVILHRKDGTIRLCIEYRKLNEITRKNSYPLPRIDALFDNLRGSKYFTIMDLISGYHQISMEKE